MASVVLAFEAVFPIMAMMIVGMFIKKKGMVSDTTIRQMNKVVFTLMLPCMIFYNLVETDFLAVYDTKLIGIVAISTICVFLLGCLIVPLFFKENTTRSVVIQGFTRGNLVYIGLPIMETLSGPKYLGLMALAIAVSVIVYNVTSVVAFEVFAGDLPTRDQHGALRTRKLIISISKGIITNPLIISALLGTFVALLRIELPDLCISIIHSVGMPATTVALILLGASITFQGFKDYKLEIAVTTFAKLILIPAIIMPVGIMMGLTNYELVVVFCTVSAPTAVASFTVAQTMGGNSMLAAQIVACTSALSLGTIFLWIQVLQNYIL